MDLEKNIQTVQNALGSSPDLIVRTMVLINEWPIALIYMNGLTDVDMIQSEILGSLIDLKKMKSEFDPSHHDSPLTYLKENILAVGDIGSIQRFSSIFMDLLSGDAILFMHGYTDALRIGVTEQTHRACQTAERSDITKSEYRSQSICGKHLPLS
ncbi:spore germination protein [Paenibacillus periandrae]|uniref:spore germination protein n=1 Tax=Paenibacillus periandrae TaxID=1761741 RepID=UPI001F08BB8A|nr:spore germination protein [Paenibacillus periandrae]